MANPFEPEESVGQLWHRFITHAASGGHPEAAVHLQEVARAVGVMFRALGGDHGLRVEPSEATSYVPRRRWLQRLAGTDERVELAWRDEESLRLPPRLDVYPDRELNRDLYLWLAALASADTATGRPWLPHNQALTRQVLAGYPGLASRYRRLTEAELANRPAIDSLPEDEAAQEAAIQQALRDPGSVETLPPARFPPHPVRLWLHPAPPRPGGPADPGSDGPDPEAGGNTRKRKDKKRHAERTESPEKEGGLLGMRMETILGWAEFLKINRASEEEEQDDDEAAQIADDMDQVVVTRDDQTVASRVRFDLDLPSEADDDQPLGAGILLPEWDYKRSLLRPDYCCLQPMVAADAEASELPDHLRKVARRLRNQFQALVPTRTWFRAQPDGSEVDLDAYERFIAQRASGSAATDGRLYRDFRSGSRDLSCLLLADLSLSTDAWINNHARVIDVIRDTVYLFSEALSASGDRFGLYGFSSRRREHVRFNLLKGFDEAYSSTVRGRIGALKPGFYTRMGAPIRHASRILAEQGGSQRLLLILTDGKPNDLDQYEGRYGIEDTRMAVTEARRQGLRPFCVTIDDEGGDYLPHLFGNDGYVVIRKPAELPQRLPTLYAQLTA